jgi:ABC-type multidrug transport system fused ATPase/permease subunit
MNTIFEVECLTKRFGALMALDAVSVALEADKIYGLLGRNGSGKTTLMRLLTAQMFAISGTFRFAVGFGVRRKDFFLGTLAMAIAVCAIWAILLGLLSLIEANVVKNWGVGLHFFHLPFFSDGAPLRQFCWTTSCSVQANPNYFSNASPWQQFWVSFALLLFVYLLGLLIGSIYQRFGRTGEYLFFGGAVLLISAFLLMAGAAPWGSTLASWLAQQTAATLGVWLVPPMVCFALASYALLRKATV